MRVHVLQHVPFEGLGCMQAWLETQQATVSYTRFFETASMPDLKSIDFIIVLGGPMSVNDEAEFPWLIDEKQFIAKAIRKNKTILGICLGAQLIANALGCKVYPNREKEIGWFPVYSLHKRGDVPILPGSFEAFHWHGETFDLPKDGMLLASSTVCKNQAFKIGRNIIGLQFHLEATAHSIKAMIENGRHELVSEPFIQTEKQIRSAPAINYKVINSYMVKILEYLTHSMPEKTSMPTIVNKGLLDTRDDPLNSVTLNSSGRYDSLSSGKSGGISTGSAIRSVNNDKYAWAE